MGEVIELDTGLLNAGLPWTEGSIADLRAALEHGADLAEAADFLCRHPMEVRAKMTELRLRFKNSG